MVIFEELKLSQHCSSIIKMEPKMLNQETEASILHNCIVNIDESFQPQYTGVGQYVLHILRSNPDFKGQINVDTGEQYSFKTMLDLSVRCALWLRKQGIGKGDIVTVCSHNDTNVFIPFLATFYVGAIFHPWYHDVNAQTTQCVMSAMNPKIKFSNENCINAQKDCAVRNNDDTKIICLTKMSNGESLPEILEQKENDNSNRFECEEISNPQETAVILFTSGSTGKPKPVELSHNSILLNMKVFKEKIPENSVTLWYSELAWISGIIFTLMSIIIPATRIIHKYFDPNETCKVIEKYKVTWIFLPPTLLTTLYKSNVCTKYDLLSLRCLITGSAKIRKEILSGMSKLLPHTLITQAYGTTELGGIFIHQTESNTKLETCGRPNRHVQMKVIDHQTGKTLGSNEMGEICFKSPFIMKGYYNMPDSTKKIIDEEGWLHTGDLAYFDDDGDVFIIDRLKDLINFRGSHVQPSRIEQVLLSHPDVIEAAVVGIPHYLDNEHPIAFVKKVLNSKVTEKELVNLTLTLGDSYRLRGGIKFLDELPCTPSKKIKKDVLKEIAAKYVTH